MVVKRRFDCQIYYEFVVVDLYFYTYILICGGRFPFAVTTD